MTVIDIVQLKEYIVQHEKIEFVLESIGCHSIQYHNIKCYYTCANKDGDNKSAIVVYANEYLRCINYTRKMSDVDDGADLLTLTSFNMNFKLKDTIRYLHQLLNLEYTTSYKKRKVDVDADSPLEIFRKVKRRRSSCNIADLDICGEEILDEFLPYPHISLIREDGIMPWTCEEFNVGYSPSKKRICFPERYWAGDRNSWMGTMGRTTIKEWEMLDIAKYIPLNGKGYQKGLNLYGLNENYKYIQKMGYVVVFESQKGVLKRHSRNDKTCVSCGCHDLTAEQIRILISLDVDIVIGFDKDVSLEHIRATCNKFYGVRNVYYIFDKWDLLGDKDSPSDLIDKLYKFMFKYKVKYDDKERMEYIKWLEKHSKN